MGNTDSIPVVSQVKSLTEYISGDSAGALATQKNFAYNNTFPVISQIASAGYAIGGDSEKALDLQKKFADDMENVIDSIPVAGHIKGGVHYAMGDNEKGDEAMKAASRSTGVVIGGIGGFAAGGPVGAVAGGIAGGAAMDGVITGSEILINKDKAKSYGYITAGEDVANAIKGKNKISVDEGFDIALLPVSDGIGGYAAGRGIGKPLGLDRLDAEAGKFAIRDGSARINAKIAALDERGNSIRGKGSYLDLEKHSMDNRANQLNPNHLPSGPGRPAGYPGEGTKFDLDNHANQLNPNNKAFFNSRGQQPPVQG